MLWHSEAYVIKYVNGVPFNWMHLIIDNLAGSSLSPSGRCIFSELRKIRVIAMRLMHFNPARFIRTYLSGIVKGKTNYPPSSESRYNGFLSHLKKAKNIIFVM